MTKVTRRRFVQGSTALATAGGMAGILATRTPPAYAQAATVHWLRWNDFVPASDQLLRRELLPEGEKALGIKINFETVNANDLQPRITSAIQSGSGPDLIMARSDASARGRPSRRSLRSLLRMRSEATPSTSSPLPATPRNSAVRG